MHHAMGGPPRPVSDLSRFAAGTNAQIRRLLTFLCLPTLGRGMDLMMAFLCMLGTDTLMGMGLDIHMMAFLCRTLMGMGLDLSMMAYLCMMSLGMDLQ